MSIIREQQLVPYNAAQMYRLVQDIEHYPEYVPWCTAAYIILPSISVAQHNINPVDHLTNGYGITAKLDINYGIIKSSFSTYNRCIPNSRITMQLISGPLSSLSGTWNFSDINNNSSLISLNINYNFNNIIFDKITAQLLRRMQLLEVFIAAAQKIYS